MLRHVFERLRLTRAAGLTSNWPRSQPFRVRVTRDSVHSDDVPVPLMFAGTAEADPGDVLRGAVDHRWLPTLRDSAVVWLVTSGRPLALIEQDGRAPRGRIVIRPAPLVPSLLAEADWVGDELRLWLHYDPACDIDRLHEVLGS